MMQQQQSYSREHCQQALAAAEKLAALPQHPFSRAFWEGTARLWRERLAKA